MDLKDLELSEQHTSNALPTPDKASVTRRLRNFVGWYTSLPRARLDNMSAKGRITLASNMGFHLAQLKGIAAGRLSAVAGESLAAGIWCGKIDEGCDGSGESEQCEIAEIRRFFKWYRHLPIAAIEQIDSSIRADFSRFLHDEFERIKTTPETMKGAERARKRRYRTTRTVAVYSSFMRRFFMRDFHFTQTQMHLRDDERNTAWLHELAERVRAVPGRFDIDIMEERIATMGHSSMQVDVTVPALERTLDLLLEVDALSASWQADRTVWSILSQIRANISEPLTWLSDTTILVAESRGPILAPSRFIQTHPEGAETETDADLHE